MDKKVYVIKAYENTYAGYHGLVEYILEECPLNEAVDIGIEESRNIIKNYDFIYELVTDGLEEESDDYEEMLEEAIQEDIVYEIFEVLEHEDLNMNDLESMEDLLKEDPEAFIECYCKQ